MQKTIYPFGQTGQLPTGVGIVDDVHTAAVDKALSARMGKYLNDRIGEELNDLDVDSLEVFDCSLGTGQWYGAGRHKTIAVTPGQRLYLTFTHSSSLNNSIAYFAWLTDFTDPPTSQADIPFVSGTARLEVEIGVTQELTAPEGAAFLVINRLDGGGNTQDWSVKVVLDDQKSIYSKLDECQLEKLPRLLDYVSPPAPPIESMIDISEISVQSYGLQLQGNVWADTAARHIAIPVIPGNKLKIVFAAASSPSNTIAFWAWFTSAYQAPITIGANIPYVDGTSVNNANLNNPLYVTVPAGASFLCLNVRNSTRSVESWEIYHTTADRAENSVTEQLAGIGQYSGAGRLKVISWNVGHFCLGAGYDTCITHEQYAEMRTKWAKKINDFGAEIFGACEYNLNFVNASGDDPAITAKDAILSLYPFNAIGSQYQYLLNAIFSIYKITASSQVLFSTGGQTRYYIVAETQLWGHVVKIVETHLDTDSGGRRPAQIAKLIADFANDPYVIIMGDFNCADIAEYKPFTNAGYRMANGGYLGTLLTWNATIPQTPADNIVCKGFAIRKIETFGDDTLTDHFAIMAELSLIP